MRAGERETAVDRDGIGEPSDAARPAAAGWWPEADTLGWVRRAEPPPEPDEDDPDLDVE